MTPQIIVRGDTQLEVALDRVSTELLPIWQAGLRKASRRVANRQKKNLREHRKVDTKQLLDSIGSEILGLSAKIGPRKADRAPRIRDYMSVIEYGRRPGSRMPPEAPIRAWARRHGIPDEAVFPIRKAIADEGLAGQPFPYVEPSLRQEEAGVLSDLGEGLARLARVFDA